MPRHLAKCPAIVQAQAPSEHRAFGSQAPKTSHGRATLGGNSGPDRMVKLEGRSDCCGRFTFRGREFVSVPGVRTTNFHRRWQAHRIESSARSAAGWSEVELTWSRSHALLAP